MNRLAYYRATRERIRRRRRAAARRRRVGVLLFVLFCVAGGVAWPRSVIVNGNKLRARRHETVASLMARSGVPLTGDLLDVEGELLVRGGGAQATAYIDGRPVSLDTKVRPGRQIVAVPGGDACEELREVASRLRGVSSPSEEVPSLQRTWVGAVTGKTLGSEEIPARRPRRTRPEENEPRRVALTFDDGPHREWTPKYLRLLERYGARATFFVLGENCEGEWAQELLRQTVAAGHEIGNHSYGHARMTRRPPEFMRESLGKVEGYVMAAAGVNMHWFRPPYRAISDSVRRTADQMGYDLALWDVDPFDWKQPGTETIARRVLTDTDPGEVILLHDGGGDRAQTLAALELILKELVADGVQCVTLSELKPQGDPEERTVVELPTGPLTVQACRPGLKVKVNGAVAKPPVRPAEAGSDLLLPGQWILERLRARYSWDNEALAFTIHGPLGDVCAAMSSRRLELGERIEALETPPLVFRDKPMLPLWLVITATAARADYDAQTRMLSLASPRRPVLSREMLLPAPGTEARRLGWNEPWPEAVRRRAARQGGPAPADVIAGLFPTNL
jgi:peptidoglycan/xylan/chitin deacetylase (PgdA/CDA1 family)